MTLTSAILLLLLWHGTPPLHGAEGEEALIVKCTRPCAAVAAAVSAVGGVVTQQYENVDAVAVRVPKGAVAALVTVAGADALRKDLAVEAPQPSELVDVTDQLAWSGSVEDLASVAGGEAQPANYNYNLAVTNVASLHADGKRGDGVVVAVIDSGTACAAPALGGCSRTGSSVIGGETFVPEDPLSATHRENGSHGTMTAEMVAAHASFLFFTSSGFVGALNSHAPGSAIPCTLTADRCGLLPETAAIASRVPMTGTAPGARIYAMKIFSAGGGGSTVSRLIAAMDRAITLRREYNRTGVNTVASGTGSEDQPFVYSALKIDVVNMSVGGPTGFAGRDIADQLTLAMLDAGITVVVSAGNDGFAAMTGGSPGTGLGSLTVGAASTAAHERMLRDLQFGPGVGAFYRPTTHTQTAYFSSRGPTADGRIDPDISANGFASFVHAYLAMTAAGALVDCREPGAVPLTCIPRIVFTSGTSFSAPTVAGAAAVLRGAHPEKPATEIRNALQQSANPAAFGDGSTRIDRGNGLVDVQAAHGRLESGLVSSQVPNLESSDEDDDEDGDDGLGAGGSSVRRNLERAGFRLARFRADRYSTRIEKLKPGQVAQIFVPSDFLTSQFTVTVDKVTPELPLNEQNQLFACGPEGAEFQCGDDVFVQIVDAPTSLAVLRAFGFPNATETFTATVNNPQTGVVRVALQGDWTNGGNVSATVTITRVRKFDGLPTSASMIEQDEIDYVEVHVPSGASQAVFELAWKQNWARYPTNDLDLVLIDPAGNQNIAGATFSSPERVEIKNPTPGLWKAAIMGFTIHGARGDDRHGREDAERKDVYMFRAEADGRRLTKVN